MPRSIYNSRNLESYLDLQMSKSYIIYHFFLEHQGIFEQKLNKKDCGLQEIAVFAIYEQLFTLQKQLKSSIVNFKSSGQAGIFRTPLNGNQKKSISPSSFAAYPKRSVMELSGTSITKTLSP